MNRREHPRPSMIGRVEVSLLNPTQQMEGYTINISRGGIGLYLSTALELNTEVSLGLRFQMDGQEKLESMGGMVRWIRPIGHLFAVGIQFKDLKADRHPLTISYVDTVDD